MRVLLTANASYAPPRGGATRSNLIWLDHLAVFGPPVPDRLRRRGRRRRVAPPRIDSGFRRGRTGAPHPGAPAADPRIPPRLGAGLFRRPGPRPPAGGAPCRSGRVVYLAHTPQFYPFGPASWNPDGAAGELVARSRRDRRNRTTHGRIHRAHTASHGRGDPSADLRYGAVPEQRLLRARPGHHDQPLRREGHFPVRRDCRPAARIRLRRGAGMGDHGVRPEGARLAPEHPVPAERAQDRRRAFAEPASCSCLRSGTKASA